MAKKTCKYRIIQGEELTDRGAVSKMIWQGNDPLDFKHPASTLTKLSPAKLVLEEFSEGAWHAREWPQFLESQKTNAGRPSYLR